MRLHICAKHERLFTHARIESAAGPIYLLACPACLAANYLTSFEAKPAAAVIISADEFQAHVAATSVNEEPHA